MVIILKFNSVRCAEGGWQMTKEQEICPYCHFESEYEDPMKTFGSDGYELFIRKDNSLELAIYGFDFVIDTFKFDEKIKFCPMCGRKLGSEN